MTNELKCPVIKSCHACGNYSKKGDWRICNLLDKAVDGSGINYLTARLPDCPFTVEKAAAVQEERRRVKELEKLIHLIKIDANNALYFEGTKEYRNALYNILRYISPELFDSFHQLIEPLEYKDFD